MCAFVCVYICTCICLRVCVCGRACVHACVFDVTDGLVLLKMKKALPSGMGGVFSFMVSSDILRGRGPGGTSGRSSSSSSHAGVIKHHHLNITTFESG